MSHVQCPNCGTRLLAASAPTSCQRCLVRRRGRFELVPASLFAPAPSEVVPSMQAKGGHAPVQAV
jgi:hypothetical protein